MLMFALSLRMALGYGLCGGDSWTADIWQCGPDSQDSLGITGRRDAHECDFREICDLHTSIGVFCLFSQHRVFLRSGCFH